LNVNELKVDFYKEISKDMIIKITGFDSGLFFLDFSICRFIKLDSL